MFGSGYVIEHCISVFKNMQDEKAFRIYMTDVGYQLSNFIGKIYGASGDLVKSRYCDIIQPAKPKKEETAEDIITRIRKKLRG